MAEVRRIVVISPSHQAGIETRQFAQFALKRFEVAEFGNGSRHALRNAGVPEVGNRSRKDFLGRLELLEQQPAGPWTNPVYSSQC